MILKTSAGDHRSAALSAGNRGIPWTVQQCPMVLQLIKPLPSRICVVFHSTFFDVHPIGAICHPMTVQV